MAMRIQKRYIALEDTNFDFTYREVKKFDNLYEKGIHLNRIAKLLGRSRLEVFLLYLDRVDRGIIEESYYLKKI